MCVSATKKKSTVCKLSSVQLDSTMFCVVGAILMSLCVSSVNSELNWDRADCAYSVWGEWTADSSGHSQQRSREIYRPARNGGQPCTGEQVEYRVTDGETGPVGPEEFFGNLLAGNTPSYSLGGGRRYTLSRDIVLAHDSTVDARIYPHYISLISDIVGKICETFGSRPQDNRMNIIMFGSEASNIYTFSQTQERALLQNAIINASRTNVFSASNIQAAIDNAGSSLVDSASVRGYNRATKEVLIVTTYVEVCSSDFRRRTDRLKTTAEVYVIVVGRGLTHRSPSEWCLKNLASTPLKSHFLQLDGNTEISEAQNLLVQSPPNRFCSANTNNIPTDGDIEPVASDEFFGNLLAGNTPSYSLGGGKRYSLSRDIVLALDSRINVDIYAYYKAFVSNIVGKICGDFGSRPQDNRMNVITFGSWASNIYTFRHAQERGLLQDTILRTSRTDLSRDYTVRRAIDTVRRAIEKASLALVQERSRRYNNATKEVLFVTTYREHCPSELLRSAEQLKTTAEVYVIVIGRGETRRSPNDWCWKSLASTPRRSHFLQLDGLAEISEESRTLLAQWRTNHFCSAN